MNAQLGHITVTQMPHVLILQVPSLVLVIRDTLGQVLLVQVSKYYHLHFVPTQSCINAEFMYTGGGRPTILY